MKRMYFILYAASLVVSCAQANYLYTGDVVRARPKRSSSLQCPVQNLGRQTPTKAILCDISVHSALCDLCEKKEPKYESSFRTGLNITTFSKVMEDQHQYMVCYLTTHRSPTGNATVRVSCRYEETVSFNRSNECKFDKNRIKTRPNPCFIKCDDELLQMPECSSGAETPKNSTDMPLPPGTPQDSTDSPLPLAVGLVIGLLAGVAITVLVSILIWRCRRNRTELQQLDTEKRGPHANEGFTTDEGMTLPRPQREIPDVIQMSGQETSVNEYEDIPVVPDQQLSDVSNRKQTVTQVPSHPEHYTYLSEEDLEIKNSLTQGQILSKSTVNQIQDSPNAYNRLGECEVSPAQPSYTYNRLGEAGHSVSGTGDRQTPDYFVLEKSDVTDSYNRFGDVPKPTDTYNRLGDETDFPKPTDTYNRLGDETDFPKPTDTYNRLGDETDFPKPTDTYNRLGDETDFPKPTDTYNRLGDETDFPKPTDTYNRLGDDTDFPKSTDTYNKLGDETDFPKPTDTYNRLGDETDFPKSTNTYNRLGDETDFLKPTDTYNRLGDKTNVPKPTDTYNRLGD